MMNQWVFPWSLDPSSKIFLLKMMEFYYQFGLGFGGLVGTSILYFPIHIGN